MEIVNIITTTILDHVVSVRIVGTNYQLCHS